MTAPENYTVSIDFEFLVNCVANAAAGDSTIPENAYNLTIKRKEKPIIIVSGPPKSGTTYLTNVTSKCLNLRQFRLSSGYGHNENDLFLPSLCMAHDFGCVSQMHMKATHLTEHYINNFGVQLILLSRNIFDTVISLKQEFKRQANDSNFCTKFSDAYSFVWNTYEQKNFTDDKIIDMIVDLYLPWYVNYYASWYTLITNNTIKAYTISYNDLFSPEKKSITKILNWLDLPYNEQNLDTIQNEYYPSSKFDHTKTEINPIGIGEKTLSSDVKTRIKRLFSYYPNIDFSIFNIF